MASPDSPDPDFIYVQLTASYAPSWGYGGPVRLMYDYAHWMAALAECEIICGNRHHDGTSLPPGSRDIDGITAKRYRTWVAAGRFHLLHPKALYDLIARIARAPGKTVIHVCELRGLTPLYALIAKKVARNKTALVISLFGHLHTKQSRLRQFYDDIVLKAFVRSIDLALVQNNHEHNDCLRLFQGMGVSTEGKIIDLPLHVDSAQLSESGLSFNVKGGKDQRLVRLLRDRYQVPSEAMVMIFLGRIHPNKGILRAIQLLKDCRASGVLDPFMIIAGRDDGDLANVRAAVKENQLEDRVRIVTEIYSERFEYYYLSDIFTGFPRVSEETMLASVEAVLCGTPALVSKEADIPLVQQRRAGIVIEYSPEAALAAIRHIAADLTNFQQNAARLGQEYFVSQAVRARFMRALSGLVCSSPIKSTP